MKKIINDPVVKIVPLPATRPPSPATRLDTEMYRVLDQVSKRIYPGSALIPSMSTGASDQAQLRAKGIQSMASAPAARPMTPRISALMAMWSAWRSRHFIHLCNSSGRSDGNCGAQVK